jgi:hypothetical protein
MSTETFTGNQDPNTSENKARDLKEDPDGKDFFHIIFFY